MRTAGTKADVRAGFTLVEIIAVLLLTSILVAVAGISLMPIAEGFAVTQQNVETAQQAQLAMFRMVGEFTTISNVINGAKHALVYNYLDNSGNVSRHVVSWSGTAGDPLALKGNTLVDNVQDFELSYFDEVGGVRHSSWGDDSRAIEITLQLAGTGNSYTNRVFPRNVSR